jgi:hypothetical protein
MGSDAQLDAGIKHLLEELKRNPVSVPRPPAFPDKSIPPNRKPPPR